MHGIGVSGPWLEMVLVESEFLTEGLDVSRVLVEQDLQMTRG